MLTVKHIGIEGIGPYHQRVDMPISKGVTVLYGKNTVADNNGNFVGKSLLVRSLEELLYDPLVRQDKKVGSRYVTFQDGKREVSLESEGSRVEVTVNGHARTQRKQSTNKELITKLWPLSQEEFSTYVYVDAAQAHPLVKGTSSARKSFFNSFFQLDKLDQQKKVFAARLLELKKVRAAAGEVERTYEEIRKNLLPKEERLAYAEKVTELGATVKDMLSKLDASETYRRLVAFKKVAGAKLKKKARSIEDVKELIKTAQAGHEAIAEYQDYVRDVRKYAEAVKGVDMTVPLRKLEKAYHEYHTLKRSRIEEVERPERVEAVEDPEIDVEKVKLDLRQFQQHLALAAKSKGGVCYACGQKVALDKEALVRKSTKALGELRQAEEYAEYLLEHAAYRKQVAEYKEAKTKGQEREERLATLEPLASTYERRRSLVEPEPVEKPEGGVESLDELRQELEQAIFLDEHAEDIEALKHLTPVEFDASKLEGIQDELRSYQTKLDIHKSVAGRARQVKERLVELRSQLEDEPALELILEAYKDTAMKKMAVEAISARLMELINQYAAQVMPTYKFQFVWESQSIHILAKRPEGVSDVRKLSGAESMLFTIILILALLAFVPPSKRTNVLILDEPTASFSDQTINLFVGLLPHITNVIPSVIIVTPKKLRIPGARCLTVVKGPKGSRLAKGHPDDL